MSASVLTITCPNSIHLPPLVLQMPLSPGNQKLNAYCTWYVLFFFRLPRSLWDLSFPDQGSNLGLLQWKCGVLTTGLPGN